MKTAQELRDLNPDIVVEAVLAEFDNAAIRAAQAGSTRMRLSGVLSAGGVTPDEIYKYVCGGTSTVVLQKVLDRFIEAGYTVETYYNESQFVDADIIVSW